MKIAIDVRVPTNPIAHLAHRLAVRQRHTWTRVLMENPG